LNKKAKPVKITKICGGSPIIVTTVAENKAKKAPKIAQLMQFIRRSNCNINIPPFYWTQV
jgi:hypothetical protein